MFFFVLKIGYCSFLTRRSLISGLHSCSFSHQGRVRSLVAPYLKKKFWFLTCANSQVFSPDRGTSSRCFEETSLGCNRTANKCSLYHHFSFHSDSFTYFSLNLIIKKTNYRGFFFLPPQKTLRPLTWGLKKGASPLLFFIVPPPPHSYSSSMSAYL